MVATAKLGFQLRDAKAIAAEIAIRCEEIELDLVAELLVVGKKTTYLSGVEDYCPHDYHVYNDGEEELLLMHVDFWHPDVTVDEKQMLAYFWMLWQFDQYHPSTRAKYTRRPSADGGGPGRRQVVGKRCDGGGASTSP